MPEFYPSSLQDNFDRGTFKRVPGSNVVVSKNDVGPSKKRRRSTLRIDTISGSILLKDLNEYNDFVTWYTSTLQDGVNDFYFNDPATGNQLVVNFAENGMDLGDVGFQTYQAKMILEIKSE